MRRCPTGKIRHLTKEGACVHASKLKSNLLNVYRCSKCEGWHIGNSNSAYRFQKRLDQILAKDALRRPRLDEDREWLDSEVGKEAWPASAIEARSAETGNTDSARQGESAVPKADAR